MNSPKEPTINLEPTGRALTPRTPQAPGGTFKPTDLYYTLFRHKGMILAGVLLGVVAAGYLFSTRPATYQSEARLLVRYVRDSKSIDATAAAGQVMSPDSRGDNILNTEVEILTSFDLAAEVASLVNQQAVSPEASGEAETAITPVAIQKGLIVEVPRRSNAIRLAFRHSDPRIAQAVLRQLITSYRRKHAEVHRALGVADEFLTRQTDELRVRLSQTEEELRAIKAKAGVILVEDAKKAIHEQRSRIQQELLAAESELAERSAYLEQLRRAIGVADTNPTVASASNLTSVIAGPPLDPEILNRYREVSGRIGSLQTRELDLLAQFGDENVLVKDIRARIAEFDKVRSELQQEHPQLLAMPAPVNDRTGDSNDTRQPAADLASSVSEVAALEARIRYLNSQMDQVKSEADALNANESRINELERKRALEESNYRYYAANLEQARVDQALGAANLPNISVVQEASPAYKENKERLKLLAKAFGGPLAAGLGLAFLLEFFVDRTIRKPSQVATELGVPLFLTVPDLRSARRPPKAAATNQPPTRTLPPGGKEGVPSDLSPTTLTLTVDPLALYHEALRDRVVMHFELNGLDHRPKLVGVTGGSHGAGTTTLAAGLAASMSETGEGKVLLVDMNQRNGAGVHPFYRGRAMCSITEALEAEGRDQARVQENLYVVTAQHGNGHQVGLVPRKFANIVPRLQAADYDYIIFDLPPVSQTSVTSKLAGLLDVTLLVLESEKSQRDSAKEALGLLSESKARVAAVLNKHKPYIPHRLQS